MLSDKPSDPHTTCIPIIESRAKPKETRPSKKKIIWIHTYIHAYIINAYIIHTCIHTYMHAYIIHTL